MVFPVCFFLYACFALVCDTPTVLPERLAAGLDGGRFDLTEVPDG